MNFATLWNALAPYPLRVDGNRLIVTAPNGLSPELQAALAELKADLIETLNVIEILAPLRKSAQQPALPRGETVDASNVDRTTGTAAPTLAQDASGEVGASMACGVG
jgi:hypothetical protein